VQDEVLPETAEIFVYLAMTWKTAFKFSSSHRYHIDSITHVNFLAGKFNAD